MRRSTQEILGAAGYVYFIQCNGSDGPIKIGRASDARSRFGSLQVGNPYPLKMLACAVYDDVKRVEAMYHQRFKPDRIRGEWFRCTPGLLALVRVVHEQGARWLDGICSDPRAAIGTLP